MHAKSKPLQTLQSAATLCVRRPRETLNAWAVLAVQIRTPAFLATAGSWDSLYLSSLAASLSGPEVLSTQRSVGGERPQDTNHAQGTTVSVLSLSTMSSNPIHVAAWVKNEFRLRDAAQSIPSSPAQPLVPLTCTPPSRWQHSFLDSPYWNVLSFPANCWSLPHDLHGPSCCP